VNSPSYDSGKRVVGAAFRLTIGDVTWERRTDRDKPCPYKVGRAAISLAAQDIAQIG